MMMKMMKDCCMLNNHPPNEKQLYFKNSSEVNTDTVKMTQEVVYKNRIEGS